VFGDKMRQVAQTGHVTRDIEDLAKNRTYIAESDAGIVAAESSKSIAALVLLLAWLCFW
jgi:hypothetical protein